MARKHDKGGRPKGDQLVGGAGRAGRGGGLATALTSSGCAEDVVGPMEEMGEDGEARYEMDPAKHAPAVRQQFLAEIKEAISNGMPVQPCRPSPLPPPLPCAPSATVQDVGCKRPGGRCAQARVHAQCAAGRGRAALRRCEACPLT